MDHEPSDVGAFITFVLMPLLLGLACCAWVGLGIFKAKQAEGWLGVVAFVLLLVLVGYAIVRWMMKDQS